jgi:hypothetical protein
MRKSEIEFVYVEEIAYSLVFSRSTQEEVLKESGR